MKPATALRRLWFYRILSLLVTVVVVHLIVVWATPRLIMRVLMKSVTTQIQQPHQVLFPPPVSAQSRSIVLPSPDMLYAVCLFDVRNGPVRVTAAPRLATYWSIALYADNSDNFFVTNDRAMGQKPVDLWLVGERGSALTASIPAGSQVVVTPSSTGFLLMRVLTGNYEVEKASVEAARHSLACTPL
jgi:uncharacterized membrane protein